MQTANNRALEGQREIQAPSLDSAIRDASDRSTLPGRMTLSPLLTQGYLPWAIFDGSLREQTDALPIGWPMS